MRQLPIGATLLLAFAAAGSTTLTAGCGSKKQTGFDWTMKRTQESGKVQATLRRFSMLPRTKENLDQEREGIASSPLKPGPGFYLVCEIGITVDGKPLWELPEGQVTQIGPMEFFQASRQLTGSLAVQPSRLPAAVRNDRARRDAVTVMMGCPTPNMTDPVQPFEVRMGLQLKPNTKLSFKFESLKVPADTITDP